MAVSDRDRRLYRGVANARGMTNNPAGYGMYRLVDRFG
jgi:hypothetical protein